VDTRDWDRGPTGWDGACRVCLSPPSHTQDGVVPSMLDFLNRLRPRTFRSQVITLGSYGYTVSWV
jgi:hypothetical protein